MRKAIDNTKVAAQSGLYLLAITALVSLCAYAIFGDMLRYIVGL